MPYSIKEHKHRFSAWAASRAASVKGSRFSVEVGNKILERSGLKNLIENPDILPDAENVDENHRQWRRMVIRLAREENIDFTHGVAAKLINIYLKSAFVCGGYHNHQRVKTLHPPIDGLLLDGLKENNVGGNRESWDLYSKKRWSNFDSDTYECVIADIRASLSADQALWLIEKFWPGYQ